MNQDIIKTKTSKINDIIGSYTQMELLRFTTAGSVDDGKSTLIGRLLYDSKAIFEDQLKLLENTSLLRGENYLNLALLTDGLKAEREQGITIDVAYRYFATPKRKFIIADTPGHIQYTRNMVTGASTANAAIILIDARNGVTEQTHRHFYIAALLQIPHIIVCVNKMDLVDYSKEIFEKVKTSFSNFISKFDYRDVHFVPISALKGDNVVRESLKMPWYNEGTLMNILENIPIEQDIDIKNPRFPVQYVIRPMSEKFHDYRGYAGRIAGGFFRKGDSIVVLPSGLKSKIHSISLYKSEYAEAYAPMSVNITLEDDIDISRGDIIVKEGSEPSISQDLMITLCWMSKMPLKVGVKYLLMHTTKEVKCIVKEILCKVNVNTTEPLPNDFEIGLNSIAKVMLKTTKPLVFDPYKQNRTTGSLIIIDDSTNETVGVGMIE